MTRGLAWREKVQASSPSVVPAALASRRGARGEASRGVVAIAVRFTPAGTIPGKRLRRAGGTL
jgi:hypothetical protein